MYLNKEQPAHIGIEMDSIVHVPLGVLLSIHGQKRGLHRGIGADLLGGVLLPIGQEGGGTRHFQTAGVTKLLTNLLI